MTHRESILGVDICGGLYDPWLPGSCVNYSCVVAESRLRLAERSNELVYIGILIAENRYWMWRLYFKKTFAIYSQGESLCETSMLTRRPSVTDRECS